MLDLKSVKIKKPDEVNLRSLPLRKLCAHLFFPCNFSFFCYNCVTSLKGWNGF